MSTLRITYRRSAIGKARDQRATLTALGLRRLNQSVELPDVATVRGMVHKVRHLVSVNGAAADSPQGMAELARATGSPAAGES